MSGGVDGSVLTGSDDRSWMKLAGGGGLLSDRIAATSSGSIIRLFNGVCIGSLKLVGFPSQDFHPHGLGFVEDKVHHCITFPAYSLLLVYTS